MTLQKAQSAALSIETILNRTARGTECRPIYRNIENQMEK